MSAAAPPEPRRGSRLWLLGLGCGVLATLATPTALLAAALLAPSLCAWGFDRSPGRAVARPMLFAGLAAALRPALAMWAGGHSLDAAAGLAADPPTLILAWAAQAGAWLLTELAPLAVTLLHAVRQRARAARLLAARAALAAEWGLPPRAEGETPSRGVG